MERADKIEETLPDSDPGSEPVPAPGSDSDAAPAAHERPLLQIAEGYLRAGIFSGKAPKVFEELARTTPARPDVQRALEICRLIQGVSDLLRGRSSDTPPAASGRPPREAVERLFGQFPGSPDLAKCLGDVRLLDGDWEGATHAYRLAQSKGYRDDQAIVNSGRATLRRADCPAAVFRYFGDLALSLGQFSQAVEFLVKTLWASISERPAAIALLDTLTERLLARLEPSADKQMLLTEIVRACLRLGLMDRALSVFRQVDIQGALHADLVKPIARRLIDQEDYRQAFDYLSHIPFDRETKSLIIEITEKLETRGEIDTAVYLLQYMNKHDLVIQEAQKVADDHLETVATRELADLCFRTGRYEAALTHYLALLKRNVPGVTEFADRVETAAVQTVRPSAADLMYMGEYFYNRRDRRRAETFLTRVLELDPTHLRARDLLRSIYDTLLKAEPNLVRMRLKSGDLYLSGNHVEEAVAQYNLVLEAGGYEMEARRRLAAAHIQQGEVTLALEQYQLIEINSVDCDALYRLHEDLVADKLESRALDVLRLIARHAPEFRDVPERIAELEEQVRRMDQVQNLRDPKMIELIGEQAVGRYRYLEQIGSGGMGIVHRVFDLKNQCVVAMKILKDSLTGSSKAIDRFFREARIAATLSHPNIVNIYDYNINNISGRSFIAMEYVDGPSLREIIENRFAVTSDLTAEYITEVLFYATQLCDALETTHLKGIIHRDIKPDNIMIDAARTVKITDFGIVHIEAATFTPTGALIGTPRYMSPEQVRGGRVDARSDIYAVGIILYEALIGTPPFISGDIAYQHVHVAPLAPREVNPGVPEEVERIVMRCLAKEPRDRYQRAREVRLALEDVLNTVYPENLARLRSLPLEEARTIGTPDQVTE
jgi:tetratricopeptide (TPR) repeat protein